MLSADRLTGGGTISERMLEWFRTKESAYFGGSIMAVVVCSHCQKKLRPPDRLAGRRVTCPRCDAVLTVPFPSGSSAEIEMDIPAPDDEPQDPPLPAPARIGIVSLILACLSVLIMCLPIVGYVSIILSGIGLPMGLWGLLRARAEGNEMLCRPLTGDNGVAGSFGTRARDYPLAGTVACLLTLTLSLLPIFMRGSH